MNGEMIISVILITGHADWYTSEVNRPLTTLVSKDVALCHVRSVIRITLYIINI
jgi:hypothetical protein